ncbi:MAG: LuxR C-terminal-related transcriptional regulator, partial [Dehalococcoidia bacterium]
VDLFRELDDRRGLAAALAALAVPAATLAWHGLDGVVEAEPGTKDALAEYDATLKLTREIDWRVGEAYVLAWSALHYTGMGSYARAFAVAQEGLSLAEEIRHRQWTAMAHASLGAIHLDLLAPAAARQHFELGLQIAHETASMYWVRILTGTLVLAAAQQRDFARAAEALAAAPARSGPIPTAAERMLLGAEAELAIAQGEPARALEIADLLAATAPGGSPERPGLRVAKVRGEALAALGKTAEAEAALLTAHDAAARHGARPMLWRIDVALGRLYQGQGRREEAERAFVAARATIEGLAAEVPDEAPRDGFLRAAAAYLPAGARPSPRRLGEPAGDGLTGREREVAALLTQGFSNREIAEALFISELTVATHVRNMLGKLGFSSRTQIAAWALERGLKAS